jgi:hypothetical protein
MRLMCTFLKLSRRHAAASRLPPGQCESSSSLCECGEMLQCMGRSLRVQGGDNERRTPTPKPRLGCETGRAWDGPGPEWAG